jgi:hypothetical protein
VLRWSVYIDGCSRFFFGSLNDFLLVSVNIHRKNMLFTTLLAATSLAAGAAGAATHFGPIAKTTKGDVVGTIIDGSVKAWLGIPFAESPPLRFAPPQEPKKWHHPLETTELPKACVQQFNCQF